MTNHISPYISLPFKKASDSHDILVIGSGYGGGVAASRLSRARNKDGLAPKITVLERGQEIISGQFPRDPVTGMGSFQTTLSQTGRTFGKDYGLYDIRIGDDVSVFVGCGLGGTSLINANVAIEADPRSMRDWPAPFGGRDHLSPNTETDPLAPYYARAREMLGSKPYPKDRDLPKLDALERVAKGIDAPFSRPDINVTFKDGYNHAAVWQSACTDCGDCVSGCNYGAKNTVRMNYLPDAKKSGADLFVGADVHRLRRDGDVWLVDVKDTELGTTRTLTANMVILAAGTLGSTEILLRSRSETLRFSDMLGERFSTNGDVWAFGYNANMKDPSADDSDGRDHRLHTYCVGAGETDVTQGLVHPSRKPGPCITGVIKLGDKGAPLNECMIIEEGVMPGALAPIYAGIYPMLNALQGDPFRFGDTATRMGDVADIAYTLQYQAQNFADTAYTGPVSRTLPFLVMNHDAATGRLDLAHDRVFVDWPDAGKDPAFANNSAALKKASDHIQAEYLPMPMWEEAFKNRVLSVHPLGGCPMGTTVADGVVNADCQVFDPQSDTHKGLYVCDGAVLPSAIGVNPHLTITAIAERAMDQLALAHKWKIDLTPHKPPTDMAPIEPPKPNPVEQLRSFVEQLQKWQKKINDGKNVGGDLGLFWLLVLKQFNDLPDDIKDIFPLPDANAFMKYVGDKEGQRVVVLPLINQCRDVLEPVLKALDGQKFKEVFDILEAKMGDFSPPGFFAEQMVGHVSAVGVNDEVDHKDPYGTPPHAPYDVAGTGAPNFTFAAGISADKVNWVVTDDGPGAQIKGTATWADDTLGPDSTPQVYAVDGTFRFLILNDDEVECWNMIYEGTMTPKTGPNRKLRYRGVKTLQLREGSHWWTDITELDFDIFNGPKDTDVMARGKLRLGLEDAVIQANGLDVTYEKADLLESLSRTYRVLSDAIRHYPREDLPDTTADLAWRADLIQGAMLIAEFIPPKVDVRDKAALLYKAKAFARMGYLILRTYGQFLSYMANFQAGVPAKAETSFILPPPQIYEPEPVKDIKLRLTRYQGGKKGPVMMALGFGALASGFATPTVERNLVQTLVADGFDVWLFDYRGSGDLPASLTPFDMDDVAKDDWPAAVQMVLDNTDDDIKDVQVVAHCVGSLVFFMAMLRGETRIRSVVSSQLGPHTIINWFKYAQADSDISTYVANGLPEKMWPMVDMLNLGGEITEALKHGMPVVNPRAPANFRVFSPDVPPPTPDLDTMIDGLVWKVPSFSPVACNSPTCHRINFFFGPTYQHHQLNQATHDAIKDMFGPLSSTPYPHIAKCFEIGHVVSSRDKPHFDYMAGYGNIRMPVHFIVGAENPLMVPECSLRTVDWLKTKNPDCKENYTRTVYQGYGHIDCLIGKNAHIDIFPEILDFLNATCGQDH